MVLEVADKEVMEGEEVAIFSRSGRPTRPERRRFGFSKMVLLAVKQLYHTLLLWCRVAIQLWWDVGILVLEASTVQLHPAGNCIRG